VALVLLQPDELRRPLRVCCFFTTLERRAQEDDACDREAEVSVAGPVDGDNERLALVNECRRFTYARLYLLDDQSTKAVSNQDEWSTAFLSCVLEEKCWFQSISCRCTRCGR
jgi:hypothetical protein